MTNSVLATILQGGRSLLERTAVVPQAAWPILSLGLEAAWRLGIAWRFRPPFRFRKTIKGV
jgi:hypothetical protein